MQNSYMIGLKQKSQQMIQHSKIISFFYVSEDEYKVAEKFLTPRYKDLITIKGTQKLHHFLPKDEYYIYATEYSGKTHNNDEKLLFCIQVKTVKNKRNSSTS